MRCLDESLFAPLAVLADEDVCRARRSISLIVVVAGLLGIHTYGETILVARAARDGVAVLTDGHVVAQRIAVFSVVSFEIIGLLPGRARALENVDRARAGTLAVLLAVDFARPAALVVSARGQRVAVGAQAHRVAEQHRGPSIRRLHVSLLGPRVPAPRIDVNSAGGLLGIIGLIAIDAGGLAVFGNRAHREIVPVGTQRDGETELIAFVGFIRGSFFTRVRCLDVRLLGPGVSFARENVHGAGLRNRFIVLIAVDALGVARFEVRGDSHRVAILAQYDVMPEAEALTRVRSFDVSLLGPLTVLLRENVNRARRI